MARWLRRPPSPATDALLAVVLALVSIGLVDQGTSVGVGPEPGLDWVLATPPRDPRPGDVWNARITVFREGKQEVAPESVRPLLTVQSATSGERTTTAARSTGVPGFYRTRVVYRGNGPFEYSVLLADSDPGLGFVAPRDGGGLPAGLLALALLATLPLALRRRAPMAVLAVTLGAALATDIAYNNFAILGPLVALYTVGRHTGRPRSLYSLGATALALPLLALGDTRLGFWETVAVYAVFAAAWLLGDNLRARRERRTATVRQTAAEEQARIARELHDVIGHSVSVMTIQAAAAGDVFDSQPAAAREALRAIETTGRETLAELRRLLAGDGAGFAPAPGLDRLDALVERVRSAGLGVELHADVRAEHVPQSVDLSAYRIVQEALTNTLRHADASTARVDVRQANGTLEITVVDDGRGGGAEPGRGHGIVGMRERALLFGGTLTAGPAPNGGFAVHARIPLKEPRR